MTLVYIFIGFASFFFIMLDRSNRAIKERVSQISARQSLFFDIIAKDIATLIINSEKKAEIPVAPVLFAAKSLDRKKPGPKPQPKQKREVSDKQREAARLMMKRRWEAKKAAQSGIIHLPHQKSTSTELPENFGIVRG
jgi:hypothetical protein